MMKVKLDILNHVYATLAEDQIAMSQVINAHERMLFKKGDILLQKSQIMDCYYIVESGIIRSYVNNIHNEEVTVDFFKHHDIAIDIVSLFQQCPSKVTIEAISDVICYKIDFALFQDLYIQFPSFSEWGRNWMTMAYFNLRERIIKMATQTATQRYNDLRRNLPEVHREVPLKHIATFLGMTDTSLSRLRRNKMKMA
ncbi:MAG: Crp/Fnr family transcriptional regulator [Saprospiraceae bacterium]|jgi:CRP-like cAMP-binding protein|nr:Crp/Fnr family transcriptional regulator [Saprospiraceae bacterium]